MIHSVATVNDLQSWGNAMYIPLHPGAPRPGILGLRPPRLPHRLQPADFRDEDDERNWDNRFHVEQLNTTGRRGLGLDWPRPPPAASDLGDAGATGPELQELALG